MILTYSSMEEYSFLLFMGAIVQFIIKGRYFELNIRDFAEMTLDYFSSITLIDIEESVLNGKPTFNNETVKEWLEENKDSFNDDTLKLVQKQFVCDLGSMPIWIGDKKFQDNVLDCFKGYLKNIHIFLNCLQQLI